MNIGIIGASGKSGGFLMREALRQGYAVTAIVRDGKKIADKGVAVVERDVFALTAADVQDFSAVIDAFRAPEGAKEQHLTTMEHLIAVFEQASKVRFMVVGGAGSLYTNAGKTTLLMDSPGFPPAFLPTASNMGKALEKLRDSQINWTYLSPAAFYDPDGRRTGSYILGDDVMPLNKAGESYVSYADYAIAMIDEIRNKDRVRKRFSVVSEK